MFKELLEKGWGAHLQELTVLGAWTENEDDPHMNILEMKAILLAYNAFQQCLLGHKVALICDNSAVISYVIW